jgi:DNA-binding CsgD family transcriptional regulator
MRISVARGLEAFAALAVHEDRPELGVQLAAAATTLREVAGLPSQSATRTESYLAPARHLGEATVARLWAQGLNLSAETAVALALDRPSVALSEDNRPALTAVAAQVEPVATTSQLTPRERQIATLVGSGRSDTSIAAELSTTPATVTKYAANILAKLGLTSRAQLAVWITNVTPGSVQLDQPSAPP